MEMDKCKKYPAAISKRTGCFQFQQTGQLMKGAINSTSNTPDKNTLT